MAKNFLLYLTLVLSIVGAYHAIIVAHGPTGLESLIDGDSPDLTSVIAQVSQLTRNFNKIDQDKTDNSNTISNLVTKVVPSIDSKISEITTNINSLVNRNNDLEFDGINSRLSEIESNIEGLSSVGKEWDSKIGLIEFNQPLLKLQLDGIEERTNTLFGTVDDVTLRTDAMGVSLGKVEDMVAETLEELGTNLGKLGDRMAENRGYLEDLGTNINYSAENVFSTKPLTVESVATIFSDPNNAYFANASMSNTTDYAIKQHKDGTTVLNSSKQIYVNVDSTNILKCTNGSLSIENEDSNSTIFRTKNNFITTGEGRSTFFRFGKESPTVSISDKEINIDGTDVLATLNSLRNRIIVMEENYLDTRKTHLLYHHASGTYQTQSGNMTTNAASTNAHYTVRHDE